MSQAHDTNTPTNIRETTEKADTIAATEVATTTTTNTQPSESAGNADEQTRPDKKQRLMSMT